MEGMRRSVVTKVKILAGTKIDKSMLTFKRPGTHLSPKYTNYLIGKVANRDLAKDTFISKEDVKL